MIPPVSLPCHTSTSGPLRQNCACAPVGGSSMAMPIAPIMTVAFIALTPPVEVRGSLEHRGGAEQSADAIVCHCVRGRGRAATGADLLAGRNPQPLDPIGSSRQRRGVSPAPRLCGGAMFFSGERGPLGPRVLGRCVQWGV